MSDQKKSDEVGGFIGFFFGFMASGFFPCRELYTLSFLKNFTHEAVEIIFLLMPPLLCKMIFQFCLIASIKLVFVTDIVDWDKGFFAYFLCPPSCSLKESRRLCRPPLKNACKVPSP